MYKRFNVVTIPDRGCSGVYFYRYFIIECHVAIYRAGPIAQLARATGS